MRQIERLVLASLLYLSAPAGCVPDEACPSGTDGCICRASESCDDGLVCADARCVPEGVCGDGLTEGLEDCDDGDLLDGGNGCSASCQRNDVCGNGSIESLYETCDDGTPADEANGCSAACQRNDQCGNGIPELLFETCDDGNNDLTDACPDGPSGTCQPATCGDGFVYPLEEECDQSLVAEGTCLTDCSIQCNDNFGDCNDASADGCEADLLATVAHCGSCDSPCPMEWECLAGHCVQTIASGLPLARGITTDATHVYWLNWGTEDSLGNYNFDGEVMRSTLDGSDAMQLASGQNRPWRRLIADDTHVYWINRGGVAGAGAVMRVPKAGGPTEPVVESITSPQWLELDGDYVYWNADGIHRALKNGGGAELVFQEDNMGSDFDTDGTNIYWSIQFVPPMSVMSTAIDGLTPHQELQSTFDVRLLEHGDGDVYYITEGPNRNQDVRKVPVGGGEMLIVGRFPADNLGGLLHDGDDVFWVALSFEPFPNRGTILRSESTPGDTVILADMLQRPSGVALADDFVYWISDEQSIMRARRNP